MNVRIGQRRAIGADILGEEDISQKVETGK